MTDAPRIARLRHFVVSLAQAVQQLGDEQSLLATAKPLLAELVSHDDWLPAALAVPNPRTYQQYLLHCDSMQRFSVVSFVWGPGQSTPIHNHGTWGLIGMLRGSEVNQSYELDDDGIPRAVGPTVRLDAGDVEMLSPATGDIHRVWNSYEDRPSISIHVYGANIGAVTRLAYEQDGSTKPFISGYSSSTLPNFWDLSKEQ
ncbi:cysteine dioxygenase family protein [Rhizorhabdus argentea]|uniref:cysteine dioxygenase family protein n=1 Tax=Rhizorhabdus argentea TaxID=1387174 RepID=UPI0030EC8C9F